MTRIINYLGRFSVAIGVLLTAGCEPPPPKPQDLGRIVYNPAEVPGTDRPYALPENLLNVKPENKQEGRPPGE